MAAANISGDQKKPHIAFIPAVGMGHLLPFARFAATLATRGCDITFVSITPTVSAAESDCLENLSSSHPNIHILQFDLPIANDNSPGDPFLRRAMAIRSSAHLLPSIFSKAPAPLSAVILDIFFAATFIPAVSELGLPSYILFISNSAMLSLASHYNTHLLTRKSIGDSIGDMEVPGLRRFPARWLPAPLHNPDHPFSVQFLESGQTLVKAYGILLNTFPGLEDDDVAALAGGHVFAGVPKVFTVGPLQPLIFEKSGIPEWLDEQPEGSVVFVSFGNRSALSLEQTKELAYGLEQSECRFLWVLKINIVDKDDKELEVGEVLGYDYLERVKGRGLIVSQWVEQVQILMHRAVGGFLSHTGFNSVSEAAMAGVPILAWPRGGDQRVCAEMAVRCGIGIWDESWSWGGEEELVKGEDIAVKLRELMSDENIKVKALELKEKAAKALEVGGSSYQMIEELISRIKDV